LDFSFPKITTEWLVNYAREVIWLDHHKTAFEMWCPKHDLPKFVQTEAIPVSGAKPITCHIVLDNDKSGAMLAWEYFHPDTPVPDLIKRIDDRDRWVFQYPDSRALHAGLQLTKPWKFENWKHLVPMNSAFWLGAYGDVVREGEIALQVYDQQIADRVKVAEKCSIVLSEAPTPRPVVGGLAVNSALHQSEIGNELAKASGTFGLVWYYDSATKRANVSLRSIGDYDVSAIAKAFGGGGHRNAAGFNIDMSTLLGFL
jgi:oligoribonuclease NrnB/cAMP/cGMP phosphodiesterase (DHH superfamily)